MDKVVNVFRCGNSLAVRIPSGFPVPTKRVRLRKEGENIVMEPVPDDFAGLKELLASFPRDFMEDRSQPTPQERDFR